MQRCLQWLVLALVLEAGFHAALARAEETNLKSTSVEDLGEQQSTPPLYGLSSDHLLRRQSLVDAAPAPPRPSARRPRG